MNDKYPQPIERSRQSHLNHQTKQGVKNNWKKVRDIVKEFRKKENSKLLFLKKCDIKPKDENKFGSSLITKYETILTHEQMEKLMKEDKWLQIGNNQNGQLIKTVNIFNLQKSKLEDEFEERKKKQEQIEIQKINQLSLVTYRCIPKLSYLVNQKLQKGNIDTTGTWVWQAQQILAYFLLTNYRKYVRNSCIQILELGAGCSGLAGLTLTKVLSENPEEKLCKNNESQLMGKTYGEAAYQKCSVSTVITDGKQQNVVFLQKNIQQNWTNIQNKSHTKILANHYIWGQQLQESESGAIQQFDILLGADILFFQQYHHDLILTLSAYLTEDNGVAVLVNPRRGCSLDQFVKKINEYNHQSHLNGFKFKVDIIRFQDKKYQCYLNQKKAMKNYDSNTDDFVFMEIRKIKHQEVHPHKYQL